MRGRGVKQFPLIDSGIEVSRPCQDSIQIETYPARIPQRAVRTSEMCRTYFHSHLSTSFRVGFDRAFEVWIRVGCTFITHDSVSSGWN
jgi:hypothetical protein